MSEKTSLTPAGWKLSPKEETMSNYSEHKVISKTQSMQILII